MVVAVVVTITIVLNQIQVRLRSSNGSALLTVKEAILQCWSEHFEACEFVSGLILWYLDNLWFDD